MVGRTTPSGSFASPERSRRVSCRRHPTCCTSTTGTPAPRSRHSTDQPPTVVSIHNLAYQGVAPRDVAEADRSAGAALRMVGRHQPALRVPSRWPTPSSRCRRTMRGRSSRRSSGAASTGRWATGAMRSTGILNGIDTEVWDPSTDPHIVSRFDADQLEAKAPNRAALLERLGFAASDVPACRRGHAPDRSEGDRPPGAPRVVARADPDAGRRARLG